MSPIDFRNETFFSIQNRIAGSRAAVLRAWQQHGPCTTEELAERSKLSILSLRPRTTELVDMGFVCLTEQQPAKGVGTYRARSSGEHQAWCHAQQRLARGEAVQTSLSLQ